MAHSINWFEVERATLVLFLESKMDVRPLDEVDKTSLI